MDDLISRQAAIAEFSCCELTPDGGIDANYAIDFLKQLPSAQRTGRWEYVKKRLVRGGYVDASECSVCHKRIMPHLKPPFCPNCGALMEGEEEW